MSKRFYTLSLLGLWFAIGYTSAYGQCCTSGINLLAAYNSNFADTFSTVPPGFQTDNTYWPTPVGYGTYMITASRNFGACTFTPQYDHTSGNSNGNYLWFDTGPSASVATPATAWKPYNPNLPTGKENLIAVTPNTTYVFSSWVRDLSRNNNCVSGGAPLVGLRINGVDMVELDLGLITVPCCPQWKQLCTTWQSGSDTTADLRIESRRGQGWTDLGIDDVYFGSPTDLSFSLGNDTAICNGQSLLLRDSTPGATYLWNDSSTASSLRVSAPGLYWLSMKQGVCTGRDSINITQKFAPLVALGNDTLICNGSAYPLIPLLNGGKPLSFLWQDNSTDSTSMADSSGLYWIQAGNECGASRDSIKVQQLLAPVVSLGSDTILCSTTAHALLPILTGGVPSNYLWQDNSTAATVSASATGLYWVQVINECGTGRDSVNLTFQSEVAPFSLGGDTLICNGASLTLRPAPVPSGNFLWQDNTTDSTFINASNGLFWLEVSNLCGAYRDSISISSFTTAPVSLGDDTIICSGNMMEICAPDTFVAYQWNNGGTASCTTTSLAGNYWVSVTASNGCSLVSDRKGVAVYPVSSVSIVLQGDTMSSFSAASYQWYLNGEKIPGATTSVYVAAEPGEYSLGITDINGCAATSSSVVISGVSELAANSSIHIYPNPATAQLFIQITGKVPFGSLGAVSIFDMNGRRLSEQNFASPIDVSSFASGVYFVEVKMNGAAVRKMWVKAP
ncbi:MAG: T9SS type A sorting domain-containing protein [Bacteroidetes bacterium]|nr:T9SS type A sorting domain-containing protein [Bacteroidota bacterium]